MESHDDEWCKHNFDNKIEFIKRYCEDKNVKLFSMTLYDLIPIIDHADKWPLSRLGHHYAPTWHNQVANIFIDIMAGKLTPAMRKE